MSITKKLLITFISVCLLGTTLFGFVMYKSNTSSNLQREVRSLDNFTRELVAILHNTDISNKLEDAVSKHSIGPGKHVFLVEARTGNIISESLPDFSDKNHLVDILNSDKSSGQLNIEQDMLIWSKALIPDTPYTLLLVNHIETDSFNEFLRSLGTPLLISSLILLWAAVWAALILSSLFRRLDQQRHELEYQTLHDPLTGLANRTFLIEQIESVASDSLNGTDSLALIVIDINRFKEINDTLGHYIGDSLLCEIAMRLKNILRESDIPIRLVSDEFAVLIAGQQSDIIASVTSRIMDEMNKAFAVDEHQLYLGASLGVAFYPEHAVDAMGLLQHAEMAMHAAKRTGTGFSIYDTTHKTNSVEQLKLVNDLRTDIEHERLELYFQPKVNLKTGEVVSAEALARWNHSHFGLIPTSRFIHIAENTGLITPLTYWALATAIQQARELSKQGIDINIAVNLSTWNLQDTAIVDYIKELLEKHHVPASRITLEITETAMMVNHKRALSTLHQFSELGLRISVDDFGTGYSSLAYLRGLPLNEVKIDKSFIRAMDCKSSENSSDSSLVRAIIDLAHDLELDVVAEGIEDSQSMDTLLAFGCDIAQGIYIANPMPFQDLVTWLSRQPEKKSLNLT